MVAMTETERDIHKRAWHRVLTAEGLWETKPMPTCADWSPTNNMYADFWDAYFNSEEDLA